MHRPYVYIINGRAELNKKLRIDWKAGCLETYTLGLGAGCNSLAYTIFCFGPLGNGPVLLHFLNAVLESDIVIDVDKGKTEIARNMKRKGYSPGDIAEMTGYPEIERLN